MEYDFTVWEPVGTVTVEADSKEEAEEKVAYHGYDCQDEDIDFEAYADGQEWELR